jgi:hypothetical protein
MRLRRHFVDYVGAVDTDASRDAHLRNARRRQAQDALAFERDREAMLVSELEDILAEAVRPWAGKYLTDVDVGAWKGYQPLVWDREPTVEEIVRHLWTELDTEVEGLREIALVESNEFDRCRTVRLTRD